jgi:hypothetical protein
MARKNVIEFIVKLVSKDAQKDLQGLQAKFIRFAKTIAQKATLVAGAIAALAGAFLVLYRNMTKSYAEFSRFSKSLGISVETLSQLEYAARQTGVGITTLKNAVEQMSSAINSAEDGIGIASDALRELDLNAKELNKLGIEDQFLVLADAFQKLDNETRAVILSQDIFGDGASEMVRLLNGGSEAIIKHAKEADALGITIKTKAAKEAEAFRIELAKLEMMQRQLQQVIITELGPAIRELAEWLIEVAKAAGEAFDKFAPLFGLADTNLASLQLAYARQQAAMDTFVAGVAHGDRQIAQSMPRYQAMERQLNAIAGAIKFYNDESKKAAEKGLAGKTVPKVGGADAGPEPGFINVPFPELTHIPTARQKKDNRPDSIKAIDEELELVKERYRKIQEEYQRHVSFMQSLSDQAARSIQSAFADFFFDPFEDGLKGMVKSFIDAIRRMIAEWLAFQTITMLGIPGFFNTAVGVPGRAAGGSVTAGNPYIVGERGPELFVPGASGTIIPNKSAMGGMNFVTNIDARGADPGLIARLPKIMEQRDRQLLLKVKDYVETGGMSL